jgi:putative inorganic carbon (hco3(-)) transporter
VTFKLFLLYSFVLLARPQDIATFLQPLRLALVLSVLALLALLFGNPRKELAAALATPGSRSYLLLFVIMILGIPFASHRKIAFEGVLLLYAANVIFFFLLVSLVTSLQKLKSVIWVICLSTFVYSMFGGLLGTGNAGGERFQVQLGGFDPNDTAYVLLSLFPPCLFFIQFNEGSLKKLVAVAATCGAIAAILLTGSRGGILALGAIVLILFLRRTGGIGKGQKIALALAILGVWVLMMDRIDVRRYLSLTDISSDYNISSEGGRLELWEAAVELIVANPVTGVGVNCFTWSHYLTRVAAGDTYLAEHAVHNSFLQIAAEVGLFGFAVYVLISARSLLTFLRTSRAESRPQSSESTEMRALASLMLLGYVGLLVSGFFLSQGYSIFTTLYFALATSLTRIQAEPHAGSNVIPEPAGVPGQYPTDPDGLRREGSVKAWSRRFPPRA